MKKRAHEFEGKEERVYGNLLKEKEKRKTL